MSPGRALLPLVALALPAIVYFPVTRAFFWADDFVHLVDIGNLGLARFVLQLYGGHLYLVRNFVFWLTYRLCGFHAAPFYWASYLTHLLNVWLVYRVVGGFTDGSRVVGCLGAALFGASPLCLGTLGWYSVYGHVLVATLLLVVLDQVLRTPAPSDGRVGLWCALLLASAMCWGVGIGLALVFPAVVFLLSPPLFARASMRRALAAFPLVVLGVYFGFRAIHLRLAPLPVAETTLPALATAHVLPELAMAGHLVGVSIGGLLQGFAFDLDRYPDRTTQVLIALFVAGLLAAFVTGDGVLRRRLAALALVSFATFAMIAIGRSNLFVALGTPPAIGARQPRYYYVGLLPPVIALCLMLDRVAGRLRPVGALVLASWLVFTVAGFTRARWHVDERTSIRAWADAELDHIDARIDATPAGETVYFLNEDPPRGMLGPGISTIDFPGLAGLFVIAHPTDVVRGRPIRFVEWHPNVVSTFQRVALNPRFAELLVAPGTVPPEHRLPEVLLRPAGATP